MLYSDPVDVAQWRQVGQARARDAASLHADDRQVAAVYMLGNSAECHAKALVVRNAGRTPSRSHDLIALLAEAGVHRSDLPPEIRVFADLHDISLRYQAALPAGSDYASRYAGGAKLVAWCERRTGRQRGR